VRFRSSQGTAITENDSPQLRGGHRLTVEAVTSCPASPSWPHCVGIGWESTAVSPARRGPRITPRETQSASHVIGLVADRDPEMPCGGPLCSLWRGLSTPPVAC